MINTLYLPEIREALALNNSQELSEFCAALHPARTAEFMEGLTATEAWDVIQYTDINNRVEIFTYFDLERKIEVLESANRDQVAELVAELAADDRVDILQDLEDEVRTDLLSRLPADERREAIRLSQYPEGTAGAMMTTEVAKLGESLTVARALQELGQQAEEFETIYYLYIVDEDDHLRGIVSARQLVSSFRTPDTILSTIMETDVVTANIDDDQEEVANKVARMDLLAIPVVDAEYRMLGIITHDDVIDVVHEEATEDAHRSVAVEPLEETYLRTGIFTLSWKRGIWLAILFFFAALTAWALRQYKVRLEEVYWLAWFIPLVISSGGNTGSQSATLVITALVRGHLTLSDWLQVVVRELLMGLLLGGGLAILGLVVSYMFFGTSLGWQAMIVLPVTLILVVVAGTLTGSVFHLIFERLGWDPAMMSNPFVTGIIDILGIVIYMNVAFWLLPQLTPAG